MEDEFSILKMSFLENKKDKLRRKKRGKIEPKRPRKDLRAEKATSKTKKYFKGEDLPPMR